MNPMLTRIIATVLSLVAFRAHAAETNANRVAAVTQTPGCVAFWDFVKREPDGALRFTAHVPEGAKTDYPLDAANYIKTTGVLAARRRMPTSRSLGAGRLAMPSAS